MFKISEISNNYAVAKVSEAMEADTIKLLSVTEEKNGQISKSHTSRRNLLTKTFCTILIAASLFFSGCNDSDKEENAKMVSGRFDGKITVTKIENADEFSSVLDKVQQVRVMDFYYPSKTLAFGSYANGAFTLNLPETLSDDVLYPIYQQFERENLFPVEYLSENDMDAKIAVVDFYAFDIDDEEIGGFYHSNDKETVYVHYLYINKDVTINISNEDGIYRAMFEKGWNKLYIIEDEERYEVTTRSVSGLKWYFYGDDEEPYFQNKITMKTSKNTLDFFLSGEGEIEINWGDGNTEITYLEWYGNVENSFIHFWHEYSSETEHSVTIRGIFEGLRGLICNGQELTDLNVTKTNMMIMQCVGNKLTKLDVSGLTELDYLYCNNNQLTGLMLNNNAKLRILQCSGNQISTLNLSGLSLLYEFSCGSNRLTALNLTGLTALHYLFCAGNVISELDLRTNTSLNTAHCQNNGLTTIYGGAALQFLSCGYNKLTTINVMASTGLQVLNCPNNQLSNLDMCKNTELYLLECKSNKFEVSGLNELFGTLHDNDNSLSSDGKKNISITDNPGANNCNKDIAEKKGWFFNE